MNPDFYRLAKDLRAMQLDFNYRQTRKLLDPNWNGYPPPGHDIIEDDVPLEQANLLTSRLRGSDLHRVVLDLDYGADLEPSHGGPHQLKLILKLQPEILTTHLESAIGNLLFRLGIAPWGVVVTFDSRGPMLSFYTNRDLVLIPSTTHGHNHLIMKKDLSWDEYKGLLSMLATGGVIQRGYAKASIAKGYSAIRTPWTRKSQ